MPAYRLHADRLTEAAETKGDRSSYAIAKRTGLSQDTIGRLRKGHAEPTVGSLMILAQTYGVPVEELVEIQDDEPVKEPA